MQVKRCEEKRKVLVPGGKGGETFRDPGESTVCARKMHKMEWTPGREMKKMAF